MHVNVRGSVKAAGLLLLIAVAGNTSAFADKVRLTDIQLDRVDAGYLTLSATALAQAFGSNAVAITNVSTNVAPGQKNRRYSYTVGRASAYAFASGDAVNTDASATFETDEEVVRSRLRVRQRSRGNVIAMANRLGIDVPRGVRNGAVELYRVDLQVVTRVRR